MPDYLFDVKCFAAIRVKAASEDKARATLKNSAFCADGIFGVFPDGTPITGEISIDDDEMPCEEVPD